MHGHEPLERHCRPLPDMPAAPVPRERALYGMPRSTLRDVVRSNGMTWVVDDGQVIVQLGGGCRPGVVVKLSSGSGMLGMPQQTPEGIAVRCLLNPHILIGCQVQINNADIQRA